MVVHGQLVVEAVVAADDGVRAETGARQVVGPFEHQRLVVPLLRAAHAAERRRVVAGAVQPIGDQRAADQVGELRPGPDDRGVVLRVLRLEEQVRPQHRVVVERPGVLGILAIGEAGEIELVAEEVLVLGAGIVVHVRHPHVVPLERTVGALPFEPPPQRRPLVGRQHRTEQLIGHGLVLVAAGGEEPQPIAEHRAADGVLVHRHDRVRGRVVGERRQRAPVVVVQAGAERAAEAVAAGLGDGVDDAAAEAAELGRDARRGDRRFLQRVLDVDRHGAAAHVVLRDDAVHQHEVLRRDAARDRELGNAGVARSGAQHAGRQRGRRLDAAIERQVLDQRLLERRRRADAGGEGVGDAAGDGDGLRDAGDLQLRVEGDGSGGRDQRRLLGGLEALQLEGQRVLAGRQERNDVVADGGGRHGADALQVWRSGGDRRRQGGRRRPDRSLARRPFLSGCPVRSPSAASSRLASRHSSVLTRLMLKLLGSR